MVTRVLQLRRGTDAERQTVTFASGEAIWTTDLQEVWVGDGSTVGGLGPFRMQGAIDHGGLAGLGDAGDHTWAALVDGSRNITGPQTFESLVTLLGALAGTGLWQQSLAAPIVLQESTQASNSDGARKCSLDWAGRKSGEGAASHYLGELAVMHDGTGADQAARLYLRLNSGAQGFAPGLFARWYGTSGLADFAGELRTPFRRSANYIATARQDIPSSGATTYLAWDGPIWEDTGFALNAGGDSTEITFSFAGRVFIGYHAYGEVKAETSALRIDCDWWLEHYTGGSWNVLGGTKGGSYHRSTATTGDNGRNTVAVPERGLVVASGEKLRLAAQLPKVGNAVQLVDGNLSIRRTQEAS